MKTATLDHGIVVIVPQGHLSNDDETDALEQALKQAFDQGSKHLIIDCTEVKKIDSTALGVLISAYSQAARTGGRLILAKVGKTLKKTFVTTKLSLVFDFYPTVELAVAALTQPQPET
ncbi:MAG: STAS domain-containing protein [Candidatus Kerfeldbacteria bacterium]|nr:STAS domain-containing protein [Candidatus Kerfeldbacteria bacterium]